MALATTANHKRVIETALGIYGLFHPEFQTRQQLEIHGPMEGIHSCNFNFSNNDDTILYSFVSALIPQSDNTCTLEYTLTYFPT